MGEGCYPDSGVFPRGAALLPSALGTSLYLALKPRHSLPLIDTHTSGYFQRACSEKSLAGSLSRHHYFGIYVPPPPSLLLFLIYRVVFIFSCAPRPKQPLPYDRWAATLCPGSPLLSHCGEGAGGEPRATCPDATVSSLAILSSRASGLEDLPGPRALAGLPLAGDPAETAAAGSCTSTPAAASPIPSTPSRG